MPSQATVIKVMISCPSDVIEETNIIRDTIYKWNIENLADRKQVLLPVSWKTHSTPSLDAKPQSLINEHVLDYCDLLVAVFWSRIGSPTEREISGTVEEIKRHIDAGKPAMVYFSKADIPPDTLETKQFDAVRKFEKELKSKGLIGSYRTRAEFKEIFDSQLSVTIKRHFKSDNKSPEQIISSISTPVKLSIHGEDLLLKMMDDFQRQVEFVNSTGGIGVYINGANIANTYLPESIINLEDAIEELQKLSYAKRLNDSGTSRTYRLTTSGLELGAKLRNDRNQRNGGGGLVGSPRH